MGYMVHRNPDTNLLSSLRLGDKIKINGKRIALTVYGVSADYVVAANMGTTDGQGMPAYTIISKEAARCDIGLRVRAGNRYCGTDLWETDAEKMQLNQPETVARYMDQLTRGLRSIAAQTAEPVQLLMIKATQA